ncbi:MAG TPA: preprotein translocase subunit YajC [Chthoniobacteraceae bacterium]|nr:preprotein translocase subunit YajC [Chthoniobacteraceae bacterium]
MISELFLIVADTQAAPQSPGMGNMIVPFICIGVIFYFLIYRPQQKRQKDLDSLVSSLKTGDKVVTNSGIHGIISNVKEGKTLSLKIADNVKIEIEKSAIGSVEKSAESSVPATAAS